jgi:DNA-binding IclR family transcriptional regulator
VPPKAGSPKSVTGRALAILNAFDEIHTHLALSDISRRSGLPPSTASRIISELEAWGALHRGGDGRYWIGLRLWELGCLSLSRTQLRDAAILHLRHLHQLTKEDAYIAVPHNEDVVYIEIVGERRATALGRLAPVRDTCHSAAGAVLMAHRPRRSRATGMLAKIRRTGLAMLPDTSAPGVHSLAVPLFGQGGAAIAAVGLFGDDIARWKGEVLTSATGIRRKVLELAPETPVSL